ncbi:hypothetical protein HBI56_133300 [Parastagonospora nodorum]|nr:hypothetical protein HBH56_036410 [Parastagonospora nodorum]KAH3952380.1 hypothetical protein HBH53_047050 [Parastagonospora nodorum]KAH3979937.1 hypothetical protein HBH51_058060 [Parastagonospora nodorum]KAH3980484.1 hypothetical protein HBH52_094210 [Parastagonospora nodorum]KAH4031965.1 hypothetical protein HBI13_018170 [Parastagonospora nodorum]
MQKRKHEDLEALFDMFKTLAEPEANALLARIRAGADPSLLVEQVKHGNMLMQLLSSSQGGPGGLGPKSYSSL